MIHKGWGRNAGADAVSKAVPVAKDTRLMLKASSLADLFTLMTPSARSCRKDPSKAAILVVQLSANDKCWSAPLAGDDECVGWSGCVEWTGAAGLKVAGLMYWAEEEGYHCIANFHLCNAEAIPAALKSVSVRPDGAIEVTLTAGALQHPAKMEKKMAAARAASLEAMVRAIPNPLRRIVMGDGLMHCQMVRHHDPCGQPCPSWWGLPTRTDMSVASAQRILEDMARIARNCLPADADDATLVAVGLAMHAGKWSHERLDDREPTYMLGEDCDDMVIRARSIFQALKRLLPQLRPVCGICKRICRFIETHQMLSCQGHACPPHPMEVPGSVIGHVYGLFVRDVDWKGQLGLRSGIPVTLSNNELYSLLEPKLCEATAPCRARPAAAGQTFEKAPGLVEIRTAEGDQSYLSVQQAQEDDSVVYFFQADDSGRWVGGIDAADLLRPPEAAPRPDKKVHVLMMKADPAVKCGTDVGVAMNEPDPKVLESIFQAFRSMAVNQGFEVPCSVSMGDDSARHRLAPRFFGDRMRSFVY